MFTLILVAINVAVIVGGLIGIGEQMNKPKRDDNDDDFRRDYPCA